MDQEAKMRIKAILGSELGPCVIEDFTGNMAMLECGLQVRKYLWILMAHSTCIEYPLLDICINFLGVQCEKQEMRLSIDILSLMLRTKHSSQMSWQTFCGDYMNTRRVGSIPHC